MKTLDKCDLCGNGDLRFLYKVGDYNKGFKESFNVFKCQNCGLVFLNPQPSITELKRYYTPDYYYKVGKYANKITERYAEIGGKLRAFFTKHSFLKKFSFPLSPFIRGVKIIADAKYLDVGCGGGQFLYEIKKLNPKAEYYGVEPGNFNEEDVRRYGLRVVKGILEDARYPSDYFDVITVNHVFEHVNNPSETLKELKRVLKPNGTLIIAVPNCNSLAYRLFGKYWSPLDAPRHLFTYSNKTLKRYAKKFDFKIEKKRYVSLPQSFIRSPLHCFGKNLWVNFSKRLDKREIFPLLIFGCLFVLFFPLTTLLNLLKSGDIIEIWLKK